MTTDNPTTGDTAAPLLVPYAVIAFLADEAEATGPTVLPPVATAVERALRRDDARPDGCDLADAPEAAERLAGATARHLRAFARSAVGPGGWLGEVRAGRTWIDPATAAAWLIGASGHGPRFDLPDLPVMSLEAAREHGAAVTLASMRAEAPAQVNRHKVAQLSAELGRYLERLGGAAVGVAAAWLEADAGRYQEATAPMLAEDWPRPLVLAGWVDVRPSDAFPPVAYRAGGRALVALALAVWLAEVRPRLAEARERDERRPAPTLPLVFASRLGTVAGARVVEGTLVSARGEPLPLAPTGDAKILNGASLNMIASLHAQRVIRWAPRLVWEAMRAHDNGANLYRDGNVTAVADGDGVLISVEGGKAALAEAIGAGGNAADKAVYATLEAMQRISVHLPLANGEDRVSLLTALHYRRGGGGRPGLVQLRVPTWWGAAAVRRLAPGSDRYLVPILPVPRLDGLAAQLHARLVALELAALVRLTRHAGDLVELGGVRLDWNDLAARDLGLTPHQVAKALEVWTDGEAARWERVAGDRWTLARTDETAAAWASLEDLGKRVTVGAEAGRKAAKARRGGANLRKRPS